MAVDLTAFDVPVPTEYPTIRSIGLADLCHAVRLGMRDFGECRRQEWLLGLLYLVAGIVMCRFLLAQHLPHLIFPLIAGFALLGPLATTGFCELSLRREQGRASTWRDMFGVVHARTFGAMLSLGLLLCGLFAAWLQAAAVIDAVCLEAACPDALWGFLMVVLTTKAGWAMIGVGLVFAAVAFGLTAVSFPLMIDRDLGPTTGEQLSVAVLTSLRAIWANPFTMALWALLVATLMALGLLAGLVGLIVVMPILGHASWYLYRRVVDVGHP